MFLKVEDGEGEVAFSSTEGKAGPGPGTGTGLGSNAEVKMEKDKEKSARGRGSVFSRKEVVITSEMRALAAQARSKMSLTEEQAKILSGNTPALSNCAVHIVLLFL